MRWEHPPGGKLNGVDMPSSIQKCMCINLHHKSLRIQVCPKKGINPTILLWGWDWDHQTYSREGYGSLGRKFIFTLGIHKKPLGLCWSYSEKNVKTSRCLNPFPGQAAESLAVMHRRKADDGGQLLFVSGDFFKLSTMVNLLVREISYFIIPMEGQTLPDHLSRKHRFFRLPNPRFQVCSVSVWSSGSRPITFQCQKNSVFFLRWIRGVFWERNGLLSKNPEPMFSV